MLGFNKTPRSIKKQLRRMQLFFYILYSPDLVK